jgi:hypothetical protein
MKKTVDEAFCTLHRRLTPGGAESSAARSHCASLAACLKAKLELRRPLPKLSTALARADKGRTPEQNGQTLVASRRWDKIFFARFPTYV